MSDADESAFEALSENERLLLERFASRGVRFVVVGGYAVRHHGCLRVASDLDLLIDSRDGNLQALAIALTDLGVKDVGRVGELFRSGPRCRWPWRDDSREHYVDLLTGVGGWSYAEVEADSLQVPHEGLTLPVLSRDRVIADKKAMAGDPDRGSKAGQDLDDLQCLGLEASRRTKS